MEEHVVHLVDTTWIYGFRYLDDIIVRIRSNESLYALQDANWNVVGLLNSSGTVLERVIYDSFGKATFNGSDIVCSSSSSYDWSRTFTGQVFDKETDFLLYRNRYYHPTLGRFITRDPLGYQGDSTNFYRYIKNHSIVGMDALGLDWCVDDCFVLGELKDVKFIGASIGNANTNIGPRKQQEITDELTEAIEWMGKGTKVIPGPGKKLRKEIGKGYEELADKLKKVAASINAKLTSRFSVLWLYFEAKKCKKVPCCLFYTRQTCEKYEFEEACRNGTDTGAGILPGDSVQQISPEEIRACIDKYIP